MLNFKEKGAFGEGERRQEGRAWVAESLFKALVKLQGERNLRKSPGKNYLDNSSTRSPYWDGNSSGVMSNKSGKAAPYQL